MAIQTYYSAASPSEGPFVDGDKTKLDSIPSMVYSAHMGHTGIANGSGCLGINADPTKFDITDGFGFVLDLVSTPEDPSITEVNWTGKTALSATYLLTNNISFIGCDSSGDVVQQTVDFSESQRRSIIVLGVLTHVGSTITSVRDDATTTDSYLAADFARAIGNINLAGNNFNAASTDLTVRREAGLSFIISGNRCNDATDPNRVTSGVEDPISFIYIYDNGAGGVTAVPATDIDPDNYDDGSGILATVANNKWTNQLCYFLAGSNTVLIRYGNEIFANQSDAELGAETIPPTIGLGVDADLVRTVINIKKGSTDLSNIAQAQFIATGRFGLGSGGGAGTGGAVQDLQDVYDFSTNPEILTDSTRGALSLKRGSAADTDDILEVLNAADSQVFSVTGEGDVYASSNVGIGTDTPSAKLHAIATTEQFRFGYDVSNYWNATTNSTGVTTLDGAGTAARFHFDSNILAPLTIDRDDVGSHTNKPTLTIQNTGTGAFDHRASLIFKTQDSGGGTDTVELQASAGMLAIFVPDGAGSLNVTGSSTNTSLGAGSPALKIHNSDATDNNYAELLFGTGSTRAGVISQNVDASLNYADLIFATRGSTGYLERMRIDSDGDITASGTVEATSIVKTGGLSAEFLKADGTVSSINSEIQTYLTPTTLTSLSSIAYDGITHGVEPTLTLGHNATLQTPTNITDGQTFHIAGEQDATGSRSLGFSADYVIRSGDAADIAALSSNDPFDISGRRVGTKYRIWITA